MNTDIKPENINPKIKNGAISRHISHISLDIEKQNEFMKCLNDLRGKKTIIFVSHRESALKDCDKVINLNEK